MRVKTSDHFSASPIPGNTISVVNTIDRLMMLGAKVVYGKDKGIHVSGHGFQEDQKLLALTNLILRAGARRAPHAGSARQDRPLHGGAGDQHPDHRQR